MSMVRATTMISGATAQFHVGATAQPALMRRGSDTHGTVALFVGIGTNGHFRNLSIHPQQARRRTRAAILGLAPIDARTCQVAAGGRAIADCAGAPADRGGTDGGTVNPRAAAAIG
jgi:hypothetical protein